MTQQIIFSEELKPIEIILKEIIYFVDAIYFFIWKLAGTIGIIFFAPVLAVFIFTLWLTLKLTNWRLQVATKSLFKIINQLEPRKLMLFHHAMKNRRIRVDEAILKLKPSSNFFLFKPLYGQIKYSRKIFLEAEQRFHITVYPHLHQSLSSEQIDQLKELSKNMEGIWEDNDFVTVK
jgi:hypothetical protein